MSRGMITSIDTVTQVSMKFRKKKKANKNVSINIEQDTNNTCEHGDKCVRKWKRREMRMCSDTHTQELEQRTQNFFFCLESTS